MLRPDITLDKPTFLAYNDAWMSDSPVVYQSNHTNIHGSSKDWLSAFIVVKGYWNLFEAADYGGYRYRFGPGIFPTCWEAGVPNDVISSLQISEPTAQTAAPQLWMFRDGSYGSQPRVLSASDAEIKTQAPKSLIVTKGRWKLFNYSDFNGAPIEIGEGLYTGPDIRRFLSIGLGSVKLEG